MQHSIKHLPKNLIEITFELTSDEVYPYLEETTERISQKTNIPGFRPGHAPYAIVAKKFGEMKLLEESLETIIRKSFVEIVLKESIQVVGPPQIDVLKAAPGNDLVFKTTVTTLPKVTKLANHKSLKIGKKAVEVFDEEVLRALSDLQKRQTRETRVSRQVAENDRVVVDLDIYHDKVAVEGGSTRGHSILMNEPYYIPGFTDSILGMNEGNEKTFILSFPETHYNKMLAGKPSDFHVKIKEIYQRDLPPLDNDFAKKLGKESIDEIKNLLKENLLKEKLARENERIELEILNQLVRDSQFDEIPDLLINEEVQKMLHELKHGVAEQGLDWNDYLSKIKKTDLELKLDFTPQAIQRIKTTLVLHEISKQEEIDINEKEVDDEIDKTAAYYKDDPETSKRIYSPDYRDQFVQALKNRKTVARLKDLVLNKN